MILSQQIIKKCQSIEKKFLRNNFIFYEDIMDELAKNKHYKTDYQKEMALEYFKQKNVTIIKKSDLTLKNFSIDNPEIVELKLSANDIVALDRLITIANRDQLKIDSYTVYATFDKTVAIRIIRYLIRNDLYEINDPIMNDSIETYDYDAKIKKDLNIEMNDSSDDSVPDTMFDEMPDADEEDDDIVDEDFEYDDSLSDIVKIYLREIGKFETLTPDQETELFLRYKGGDMKARDEIINHNLKLVVSVAKKYQNYGLPIMDVIQYGNLGLMKAVDKFDISLGNKFSTYAVWWIKQCVMRGISTDSRPIRLPVHVTEQGLKIKKARAELKSQLDREPSTEELIKFINANKEYRTAANKTVSKFDIQLYMDFYNLDSVVSLDTPINSSDGDCDTCIGDYIAANMENPEDEATKSNIAAAIKEILNTHLNDKQLLVINCRFGLNGEPPMTLEQVGDKLNITRERVRQIEAKALMKLRRSPKIRRALKDLDK